MSPRRSSRMRRREALTGLAFISPGLVGLALFVAYPLFGALFFSLTDYSVLSPPRWVGAQNYRVLLTQDTLFWVSMRNTALYGMAFVVLSNILALALAFLLASPNRGSGIFRTLIYLPALIPPIAASYIWIFMLRSDVGVINRFLRYIGLPGIGWFSDPTWSVPSILLMTLWAVGSPMLIYLAGIRDLPQQLLEAATTDGASRWQRFWHVVLPLLSPVMLFNLVISVIFSVQVFTEPFVASTQVGGSLGSPLDSMLFVVMYIYANAFRYFAIGYASAAAFLLMLFILLLTLVFLRSARYWVHYDR